MKKLFLFGLAVLSVIEASFSQNINVTLSSRLPYPGERLSNICGWVDPVDNKEYALVGAQNGLSIVDVSNPALPVEIIQVPGPTSIWREIKTVGNYAYVTCEDGTIGLQIVDLTNLPGTNLAVATWKPKIGTDSLETIHALHAENGKVYLYGSNVGNQGCIIADVTTAPMVPIYLGSYDPKYVHDGYVRNDTLYAAHIYDGDCSVVDVSNPASPILLATFSTPGTFTHNTWLSDDSKTCFTTDEVDDSYLAAFNIANLSNIFESDRIQSNPGSASIVHNTHILNVSGTQYAVTSWYKDGITIVDASRPNNLVQVGNYDTSPLAGGGYDGAWGVYPFLPSGTIVVSDIDSGLYVLAPTYERACYVEGVITDCISGNPVNGVNVQILNPGYNENSASDITDATGQYAIGVLTPGTYSVTVSKVGFINQAFTVTVSSGNVIALNAQLCVTGIEDLVYDNVNVIVSPNPFTTKTLIRIIGEEPRAYSLMLCDVYGRVIKTMEQGSNLHEFELLREDLSTGIYYYRIMDGAATVHAGKICAQ